MRLFYRLASIWFILQLPFLAVTGSCSFGVDPMALPAEHSALRLYPITQPLHEADRTLIKMSTPCYSQLRLETAQSDKRIERLEFPAEQSNMIQVREPLGFQYDLIHPRLVNHDRSVVPLAPPPKFSF